MLSFLIENSPWTVSWNSWHIPGEFLVYPHRAIPEEQPGILQGWRVSGMIISVGIGWEKIPGSSSRNPPGILPFLVGVPGFLEDPTRNRGGGVCKDLPSHGNVSHAHCTHEGH
jgi:hypothetical protein